MNSEKTQKSHAFFIFRLVVFFIVLLFLFNILGIKKNGGLEFFPKIDYDHMNILYYSKNAKFVYYCMVIAYYFAYSFVLDICEWFFVRVYRRRVSLKPSRVDNFIIGVEHFSIILNIIGGFLAFLALFNLEFKEVFTGVSFFAAAFAILFKDYITNLLNGMIFTFSKRITIDDYVKIGVYKGLVIDISMMHVSILNDDDDVLLLPNNYVFANEFTNYTENGQKHTTIEFEFNVQLPPDFKVLREIILQSIVEYEPYLVPESITIKVSDIREYHIKIKFHYTMKIFKRSIDKDIKKAVNAVVLQYMTEVKDLYIQKNKITLS